MGSSSRSLKLLHCKGALLLFMCYHKKSLGEGLPLLIPFKNLEAEACVINEVVC